ncbi:MAG: hypothetical protein LRY71_01050 [Bacillaceae bacterium]|nr:hypothetical protein [Bacillaceae bacterium]
MPIETTGDGAVNVYSRIQMMLFKAREVAKKEYDDAVLLNSQKKIKVGWKQKVKQKVACTAANAISNH